MKTCEYCGQRIAGEALEITPVSDSCAMPNVYWHKEQQDCGRPRPPRSADSVLPPSIRRP